ncbi:MAG TPA: hypothetical protein PKJ33_03125 [Alphaproteobacteria bacterium]|nr:hypothetical protein [Alphaproteobacteria bacterium]
MNFLNRLSKKKEVQVKTDMNENNTDDIAVKYIIKDPKNVFVDYDLFSSCEEMPVCLENNGNSGWLESKIFPTGGFIRYLSELKKAPLEFRNIELARTITEYDFAGKKVYILPTTDIVTTPGWSLSTNKKTREHMLRTIREYRTLNQKMADIMARADIRAVVKGM